MPTAMAYAIDTILRLCEENTRLKCGHAPTITDEEIVLVVKEKEAKANGKKVYYADDDWELCHEIGVNTLTEFLAEEHSYHIYNTPPPTVAEVELLKESADLIADSQQKQIKLLLDDKRERMEDRERLVKRIVRLEEELAEMGVHIAEDGSKARINGRGRPKKTDLSPCMSDPHQ